MARGRMLSRTLGSSRRFNEVADVAGDLTEFAQLLFTLLVPHADDFGRMAGDAFTIRLTVFPGSSRKVPEFLEALQALHAVKLITIYEADGAIWLQISKFDQHQAGLHKRTTSLIPEWPGNSRKFPESSGTSSSRARAELNLREEKGREDKRSGEAAALSQDSTNEDGSTDRGKSSAAGAARPTNGQDQNPEENIRVITKFAHEAIDLLGIGSEDLVETVKGFCATRQIPYNSRVVVKAVESAEAQRRLR